MTIDWLKFIPALLLLFFPGDLLNGGKVRYRDVVRDWDGFRLLTLAHGQHAIDLLRATLGMWWLLDSLYLPPNVRGFGKYEVLLVQGIIRILAVLLQTVVCRERDAVNAPFAFVVGMLLGGISPVVAAFAVALAWPLALGLQTPSVFFLLVGLAHLGIGYWFKGKGAIPGLAFGAVAATIPFFWSILFHRELVVAHRAKRRTPENEPSPLR